MDWLQFAVQWMHVLVGIFWFGTVLATNLIFIPALNKLPLDRQREMGGEYGKIAERLINPAAMIVIALGVLRGTVFGSMHSVDALFTTYGLTWLVGLIAATATFGWGKFMIEPALHRMNVIPVSEALQANGAPSPVMLAAVNNVKRVAALEMIGFFVIFTCMILMRFGL